MIGGKALNLRNDDFVKGLLFLLVGVVFILWSFDIVFFAIHSMIKFIISLCIMYYGYRMVRYNKFGYALIFIGVLLILKSIGIYVPVKFIFGIIFLLIGTYFLVVKLGIFIVKKGIFKDSRDMVYINEKFSSIIIKNNSDNLSFVKVRAIASDLTLDFQNTQLLDLNEVNFEINSIFSKVKIISNFNWNIILNGQIIRTVEGSNKTINIKCINLYESLEIE